MKTKYQQNLDKKGIHILTRLSNSAKHMNELIEDLLAYSRVDSQPKDLLPIDCNTILQQVLADMQTIIEQSGAKITYNSLPTVIADAVQLVELFQNLINNAIKFHRPESPPKVTISAKKDDQNWHFEVCDDGIGIDSSKFESIFQVFQRLHSKQDYPGTGIGLATCRKVVERNGGKIWVESKLNAGSSFHFTFPIIDNN